MDEFAGGETWSKRIDRQHLERWVRLNVDVDAGTLAHFWSGFYVPSKYPRRDTL